jgi:hypothetical protein
MKKFIITEEEKNHIKGLYERIGGTMTPEISNSPKSMETKKKAGFLNSYYKINLNAATTGNWQDKDYNENLKKFMEEKGITVWVCKKGDGYCSEDGADEGEITTKEMDKLRQAMGLPAKGQPTTPQTNGQEKINTTNDKTYDYKLSNGKYYYSLKNQNKWIEAKDKGLEAIKTKVKF